MSWFDQSHPTSDGLPYAISRDNELYMTSLRRYHEINDEFNARFERALLAAVEVKPGLTHKYLDRRYDRIGGLPWIAWEDDPLGGYWVGFGIEHRAELPPTLWRTHLSLTYLQEAEDGNSHVRREHPLDFYLDGQDGTRNVVLLASILVTAASLHRLTLHAPVVIT